MGIYTQRFLRIIIPALLTLFLFHLVTSSSLEDALLKISQSNLELTQITLPVVVLLALGFVIHWYLRPLFLNGFWAEVDFSVKRNLVQLTNMPDSEAYKLISAKKRLIRIFYKIIDSDESLKNTSDAVRLNGVIITTMADIVLISSAAIVGLAIKFFLVLSDLGWSLSLLVILVLSVAGANHALKNLKKKHIEMGSDQLAELRAHHRTEVDKLVKELLNDLNENKN